MNFNSYRSFSLSSLLFGILLVALPASLSAQVNFTALDDLSVNASIQTGLSGGTPTGGVYSGPGVSDDGNGMTYTFNPVVAGVGVHTLTYTVGVNSASDDVEVLNLLPPSFSKSFDFTTIGPGSVTTLTFTIDNSGSATGVTNLDFTDNLPAGMTIATPANVTNSCGMGTVTAPDGGTTISYTDGTLGAFGVCTITVDVTSSTPGTHTNTTGDLNSSHGNSGTASANLTVATNRPGFSKSFSPASVNFGERSTLTFTLDNTANTFNMFSLDFTDNLPAGMVVASPPNISMSCSGGTLTAEPGSSVISYNYPGASPALAAGSSCTISVDVIGNTAGTLNNSTGSLTGQNSGFLFVSSGKATAALDILTPTEIFLQKSFNPNPASPGGTTNLEFSISNFSRDFEATNITFSDDLTTVLAGLTATGTPLNDVCGTGSVLSGTTTLTLTGGTIPAEGTCTFSVPLSVPGGAAGGIYTNTTSAISGDINGSTITGNMANENLTIAYAPTITKSFLNDPIVAGGVTTLEFTITNTDPTNPLTDITFTDNISAFLSGTTISSLPPAGTCGASSVFVSFLDLGELTFQMIGGEIAAGGSCTFSIDLLIPTNTGSGSYTNTTSFLSSVIDGDIVLGNPASDDLEILALPDLSKSFTNDPVDEGDIVNLEFEITYDDFATVDATAISFTDDLNAVIPGLSAIGLPINDVCGVGSQLSGTTNLSFTGGTMSPGDVCTFSVPVQVPPGTLPGAYTNTTSSLNATVDGQTGNSNVATDDLFVGGLTFTKEFIDDPVVPGDLTTLRFTIDNSTAFDYTVTFFTDDLNSVISGMAAVLPPLSNSCGTTISGTTFLIGLGGTVTAGTSCVIDVEVMVPLGTAPGGYTNTTSALAGTLNGSPVSLPPASDVLEVNDNYIALNKTFTDDPVLPGGTVTVEYTLTNLDLVNAVSNIAFTDDFNALLPGLQATGLPMAVCGGTVSGTGLLSFTGGSLAPGASCTFSVTLQTPVNSPYGGSLPCPTSGITGEINGFPVVGDPASDNLDFQLLQFSKSFAGDVEPGGSTTLTFTITNPDPINSVNAIRFTDDLDAVLSGMVATNLPLNDICGPGSSLTGTSTILFNDGVLGAGQSCTFDVIVETLCGSVAGTYLNTTSEITATGVAGILEGDPASDNITVLSVAPTSFTAPADLCIDEGVQAGLGGGTLTGGVYSGSGVTDDGNGLTYSFDPASAGVGTHTITYMYTDGNGCTYSASDDVEVFDSPMVTLMSPGDFCITTGVMTFSGGSPTGGVYSGSGVMDNSNGIDYDFDPAAAGLGMHTITYDYTSPNGCSGSAMTVVNVAAPVPVSITIPPSLDTLCIDAGIQVIANAGSPTGGVYTGTGVTDDGNGTSFTFDPASAGAGLHLITYTVSGAGCSGMFTDFIHVFDLPIVTFSIPAAQDSFCVSAAPEVISGGAPPGGVYSGTGVTDDGNGTSFTFDAAAAGVGFHLVTYTYTDGNGCTNSFVDFIQVFPLPVVTFTAPADLCVDAGVQAGLGGGTPTGGVYSGTGVTDDGNGMTYSFDPAGAGVGVHTITYTYTDIEGCEDSASDDIEVYALPVVTFTALADLCIDAGVQAAQTGGTLTGGVYSGAGVTDDGNGMTYSFDPAGA
ncbi:MAG: hypothetical protein P1U56_16415, partial [Saprospiraceae bacterium]|nr:hypothetical protein [Saprospiraceae bacterium]